MPYYISLSLCIVLLIVLIFETYLIITRNRLIRVKGKDDYFTAILILLFILLIFPLDIANTGIESFRNMLAIMIVFASFAIKRGLMDKGVAKFGFIIPWSKIQAVYFEPYQTMKVAVVFKTKQHRFKLLFHVVALKELFETVTLHCSEVMVEKGLDQKLKQSQKMFS